MSTSTTTVSRTPPRSLEEAVGPEFSVLWFETRGARRAVRSLLRVRGATCFALVSKSRLKPSDWRDASEQATDLCRHAADRLGLELQPLMDALLLARAAREDTASCRSARQLRTLYRMTERLEDLLGVHAAPRTVFLGTVRGDSVPRR